MKPRVLSGLLVLLLALIILGIWPFGRRQFRYYVFDPIPPSVRNIRYAGEWLKVGPEPVCFLRFTAAPEDIDRMIREKGFREAESGPNPTGPVWWEAKRMGAVSRVYARDYRPKQKGRLYVGKNRRWTEVMTIDSTGTNVYFLVWGI